MWVSFGVSICTQRLSCVCTPSKAVAVALVTTILLVDHPEHETSLPRAAVPHQHYLQTIILGLDILKHLKCVAIYLHHKQQCIVYLYLLP